MFKEILKKYKKDILKILILIVALVLLAVGLFFLLKHFGLTSVDSLRDLVESCGPWKWFAFIGLEVVCSLCLCFLPGTNMTFILAGCVLFGYNYKTFLVAFSGVIISSVLMDLAGRFGLKNIMKKLIGEDDLKKATNLINKYGKTYIPLFYLLPAFPDDAICCVCGAMKINFWYHLASIILCRGIGVATIVFGLNLLPQGVQNFTSTDPWEYIQVITVIVFWVIVLFTLATRINKRIEKNKSKGNEVVDKKDEASTKSNEYKKEQKVIIKTVYVKVKEEDEDDDDEIGLI